MTPKHPWIGLIVFLIVCFAAAGIGGAVTTPKIGTWYATLAKPSWNPPNWIFGPVWSALYFCMAVAAWLVWRQDGFNGAKLPLTLFAVQLALNVLWSCIFFGLEKPGLAFVEVLLLSAGDCGDDGRRSGSGRWWPEFSSCRIWPGSVLPAS